MAKHNGSKNGKGSVATLPQARPVEAKVQVREAYPLTGPEQDILKRIDAGLFQDKIALADVDTEIALLEARRNELRKIVIDKRKGYVEEIRSMARAKGIDDNQNIDLNCQEMVLYALPKPKDQSKGPPSSG